MSENLFSETPREVNVTDYAESRAAEIAELLAVIDRPDLPQGEVSQGQRTFIQRLPRHLRRRAMSYNVKVGYFISVSRCSKT